MTPERWSRVEELFEAALERDPAVRRAFLASACGDDELLRREIEGLLDSDQRAGDFGQRPIFELAAIPPSGPSRSSGARLEVGSRLGRYEVVGLLGAGGMGEVYRAHDPQLDRDVGIKTLPIHEDLTAEQVKRFAREARAAAALNHPNILTVYDVGVDRDIPFVVSELLHGETLRAFITSRRPSPDETMAIATQLAAGLAAAHDKGLVHRDLKPDNLFLTDDGVVKILDFGLAKRSRGAVAPNGEATVLTAGNLIVGTAGYMSPEQVRGQQADPAADVFAAGCVLYELVTGRRAFSGDSPVETMHSILTSDPAPPAACVPGLSPALAGVIETCLKRDPAARFASGRELAAALERVAAAAGGSTRVLARRARRDGRRPVLTRIALAAVALTVVAAGAALVIRRSSSPAPSGSDRPSIAVLALEDRTGDKGLAWLAAGVPRMLITAFAQTPGVDVISLERLEASFETLGRSTGDRAGGLQAARHAGAGAVLAGTLFKVGSGVRIDVQIEDTGTGRILAAGSEQGPDVFVLVDALAARLRAALKVADRPGGRPVREVTTRSIGAYALYVKGMEASHNHRRADARTILDEVVRIDPEFALARAQLAIILERLGEPANAARHRAIVMAQLDRLPERQRLLALARHESETDLRRARATVDRLLERYPDEEEGYDLLVHTYASTRDPEHAKQALELLQRWNRAIPGPGSGHFHNHYGYALMDHGLFTEAEREFRAYIQVSPNEANPYDSLAELFLLTGRPDRAIVNYDRALGLNPLFGSAYFGKAYGQAMLERYPEAVASAATLHEIGARSGLSPALVHLTNAFIRSRAGRYREAGDHIAAAARVARESEDAAGEGDAHLFAAMVSFERHEFQRAVAAAQLVQAAASRVPIGIVGRRQRSLAHLVAGASEAAAGRLDAARRHHADQRALAAGADDLQVAWQRMLEAEIALAAGQLEAAEASFRGAAYRVVPSFSLYPAFVTIVNNLPFRDGVARVAAARGLPRDAALAYGKLNQPGISSRSMSVVEPRFVLAAARYADRAGDAAAARAEYTRFLDLWKDADPDLPELSEARAYGRASTMTRDRSR